MTYPCIEGVDLYVSRNDRREKKKQKDGSMHSTNELSNLSIPRSCSDVVTGSDCTSRNELRTRALVLYVNVASADRAEFSDCPRDLAWPRILDSARQIYQLSSKRVKNESIQISRLAVLVDPSILPEMTSLSSARPRLLIAGIKVISAEHPL
jgi:hypothetical protein